jgi:hypothetical protein
VSRYDREAELSRASILVVAGGALIAVSQQAIEAPRSPAALALLAVGGLVVVGGLIHALRILFRRRGGADQ